MVCEDENLQNESAKSSAFSAHALQRVMPCIHFKQKIPHFVLLCSSISQYQLPLSIKLSIILVKSFRLWSPRAECLVFAEELFETLFAHCVPWPSLEWMNTKHSESCKV